MEREFIGKKGPMLESSDGGLDKLLHLFRGGGRFAFSVGGEKAGAIDKDFALIVFGADADSGTVFAG